MIANTMELRELRRVYDHLCLYSDKHKVRVVLLPKRKRLALLKSPEMADEDEAVLAAEIHSLECDVHLLEIELSDIQRQPMQHIRPQDVASALKRLGKPNVPKKEILEMIWEADEKFDGVIDWDEFCLNFQRNIHDKSGLEPANLYNIVQFMIYDQNDNGFVSIDETMNMLYARYGRQKMEAKITTLFGAPNQREITETGREGGEINFAKYVTAVERTQMKMFDESELGRSIRDKGKRKTDPNKTKKKKR